MIRSPGRSAPAARTHTVDMARKWGYNLAMETVPLAEAKDHLSALVGDVAATHARFAHRSDIYHPRRS